ncbi:MAG: lipid II flippase MurJ, partial [Anaerolineales bacterium]
MTETTTIDSSNRVARSTIIVMGGLATSIVFGFLRQRVIALQFGTSAELDAFTAANGVPELLFTMLAGGALAFAFIPIYTQLITDGEPTESNLLLSRVVNTILLLVGSLGALLAILAPTLVSAPWGVGPSFPPEIQSLTAQLMRVLFVSTVIFAASSILTGALHAHQHFLLPALAPSMYSLGIIFGALFLGP